MQGSIALEEPSIIATGGTEQSVNTQDGLERPFRTSQQIGLVLPTLNAGNLLTDWLDAFESQTLRPDRLLMVDSSSNDDTVTRAARAGFDVNIIERSSFSHGRTRQDCVEALDGCDIVIFLTQDATLASPDAIENLVHAFRDERVGAVYGRQLPRPDANPIEAHARLFNYPSEACLKGLDDVPKFGMKTVFFSNSFGAYRRTAFFEAGGFPGHAIQSEDMFVAARMILAGWKVAYCAEAQVFHSHGYGFGDEFRRYFDIGVFHARDRWIRDTFGGAEGEGLRYVQSEMKYLREVNPTAIPSALIRSALKLTAYKLGNCEHRLPGWLKRLLSANKTYWHNGGNNGGGL